MRRLPIQLRANAADSRVRRVVAYADLAAQWLPGLRLLALVKTDEERQRVEQLRDDGLDVEWAREGALEPNDIVARHNGTDNAIVLFRQSDVHHSLLLTNRCNSRCLMCSQPPTPQEDDWRVDEAVDIVRHIAIPPSTIGLTGGEPTLIRGGLRRVIDAISAHLPSTSIEVLTNARLLGDGEVAKHILHSLPPTTRLSWLVPLYGHASFLHDFVVQSPGAFDETISGLLQLRHHEQPIQLRVVLIEPVLQHLPALSQFIGRNLPFVREVALMACEPIGFALANREHCEVDLTAWADTLLESAAVLQRHRVPFIFMNTPLCSLPRPLRRFAHKSISDWKNVYAPECTACSARASCCGLFAWHTRGWAPAPLRPIVEEEIAV